MHFTIHFALTHDSQPSCEPFTSRTEPRRPLAHGQQIADAPHSWHLRNCSRATYRTSGVSAGQMSGNATQYKGCPFWSKFSVRTQLLQKGTPLMTSTKYIGMDVHKESISIAVRDDAGKIVMESVIETKASMILRFINGLHGAVHVTFEEGTGL